MKLFGHFIRTFSISRIIIIDVYGCIFSSNNKAFRCWLDYFDKEVLIVEIPGRVFEGDLEFSCFIADE